MAGRTFQAELLEVAHGARKRRSVDWRRVASWVQTAAGIREVTERAAAKVARGGGIDGSSGDEQQETGRRD